MLFKLKMGFTIFALYEIIMVVLLHCQRVCVPLLGETVCQDWMRYFVAVVIIPLLVFLICMWVRAIIRARKHRFWRRARGAVADMVSHVRDGINKHVSREDIEKYIAAAALAGLKKYSSNHPKFRKAIQDILSGNFEFSLELDDDFDDDDLEYEDEYEPKPIPKRKHAKKSNKK